VDLFNLVPNSADDLSAEDLFTEDIVYKKLCILNVSKSPGPDNIHPHLLKKLCRSACCSINVYFSGHFRTVLYLIFGNQLL